MRKKKTLQVLVLERSEQQLKQVLISPFVDFRFRVRVRVRVRVRSRVEVRVPPPRPPQNLDAVICGRVRVRVVKLIFDPPPPLISCC